MSNEKRIVLFVLLVFGWMFVYTSIATRMGWNRPPKKAAPIPPVIAGAAKDQAAKPPALADVKPGAGAADDAKPPVDKLKPEAKADAKPADTAVAPAHKIELVPRADLLMGAVGAKPDSGYNIEVQLEQKGAGIEAVWSALYDAEFENAKARKRPLELIRRDFEAPVSLSVNLSSNDAAAKAAGADASEDEAAARPAAANAEDGLDSELWEVVPENGKLIRTVSRTHPLTNQAANCQEVVFRTTATSGVVLTKTFRIFEHTDGLELDLKIESPDKERKVVYNLLGPHGIPIEGEWYTGTFRDVVFGQLNGKKIEIQTTLANEVAGEKKVDNTKLPLVFAGVENQYFALLVEPAPSPTGDDDRFESKTVAEVMSKDRKDPSALQKASVGVRITSRPISVGPNHPIEHHYRIYAGPKIAKSLADYHAAGLASYRKNQWIPFAPDIATYIITPTLSMTYNVTDRVSHLFGGTRGNYGIAIILLTLLVRGLMFPIGRKQALAAQKMQELQPHLKALQEQYKEDKERLTKETFALYKKHGVNPVAGCIPALIQLPIFVGLWQALNTSFSLRHANFLWIRDLAAPDMMFPFPMDVPFLGKWFNLLPFLVVGLMLVQTKLFSPPATTPEAEMQQKMMKYMMIFMGFMFYKVPSGLGLYFITSSLWAIGERLLLPKVTHAHAARAAESAEASAGDDSSAGRRSRGSVNGDGVRGRATDVAERTKDKPAGRFAQFLQRMLDEARKDPTYRKMVDERGEPEPDEGRDQERPRQRQRPRRR